MYPQRELRRLAIHKATLRREIAVSRAQCMDAAVTIAQPLEWVDRASAWWAQLPPLLRMGVVPLAAVLQRTIFRRWKIVGKLVRFGPLILGVIRGLNSVIGSGASRRTDNQASAQNGFSTHESPTSDEGDFSQNPRFRT